MMLTIAVLNIDFGSMKIHEDNAKKGDLFTTPDRPYGEATELEDTGKGTVKDLLIPIIALIICCVIGMIYTGGFFEGADFVTAFSNSDASVGLAIGSAFALVITIDVYKRQDLFWPEGSYVRKVNTDDFLLHELKGRYLWVLIRISGAAVDSHFCMEGFRVEFPWTSFSGYLPEIYQEAGQKSFFERYMAVFQSMYEDLEQQVDHLDVYKRQHYRLCNSERSVSIGNQRDYRGQFSD